MRIYLDVEIQEKRFNHLFRISETENLFKKYNLEFVDSHLNSELIIVLLNSSQNLINTDKKYIFETTKPIIILERCDAVNTWCRDLDKVKNCIGVFKNRSFRESKLNNSCTNIYGKTSYYIIEKLFNTQTFKINNKDIGTEIIKKEKMRSIEKNKLKLIQTVLWDFHSSILSKGCNPMFFFRNNQINFNKEYDIFCVNQTKDNDYVNVPRENAKNIINNLSSEFKVITQKLDREKYKELLASTKVCVACWGYGEWVHMDGYAMYAGVILIKPECDYVKMFPDIYKSHKRYIPCKPDFSDLRDILINVLSNYDKYRKMLIRNRQFLLKYDEKKAADIFWKKVLKSYSKSKN